MFITLVPLFDRDMAISAYSVFSQRENQFLNPLTMMTSQNDGANHIPGLELLEAMGIETLVDSSLVFVPITNISVFSDVASQCPSISHNRIVLLIDCSIPPIDMYLDRLKELKAQGFKLAIRKIAISDFVAYGSILRLVDFVFLNNKKVVIEKAKIFFSKLYPNIHLIAGNIENQETFEALRATGGYDFYEGEFYRIPLTKGETSLNAMKANYLELLKIVNDPDFDLQNAADIVGRDPALTVSLLKMVNRVVKTAEITTIRHAAAMLGQKELKRWISAVVTKELYSDKPSELSRLSLLRGRFAENLAPLFDLKIQREELFLMGLFSVLDVVLQKPMSEALEMIQVSKPIRDALVSQTGPLAPVYNFMLCYENADWAEASRIMVLNEIELPAVYDAYKEALIWYRMTLLG